MKLNERIIQLRKDKGLTQEDLASCMNVDTQLIIDWEKGELEPNAGELIEIAKIFNISLDELVYSYKDNFEEPNYKNEIFYIVKKIVLMLSLLICLITYITLGFLLNLWHPAWIIFLLIPIVDSIFNSIEKRKLKEFNFAILVVIIYLILGLQFNLWHPYWFIFLTIPFYYYCADLIDKLLEKNK